LRGKGLWVYRLRHHRRTADHRGTPRGASPRSSAPRHDGHPQNGDKRWKEGVERFLAHDGILQAGAGHDGSNWHVGRFPGGMENPDLPMATMTMGWERLKTGSVGVGRIPRRPTGRVGRTITERAEARKEQIERTAEKCTNYKR
jgi:hypothetical protein